MAKAKKKKLKAEGVLEPAAGGAKDVQAKGPTWTLEEVQALVGGYVTIINVPNPQHIMLVDEDGDPKGLPFNEGATALVGSRIVGPALIIGRRDFQ